MSLQDSRGILNHSSRAQRFHQPQLKEARKPAIPLPAQVRMLDGRFVSELYFESMCESSCSTLEGKARGCANMFQTFVPPREWSALCKWMRHQRERIAQTGVPGKSDDTFVAVLITHTAAYRKVSPVFVYDEIIRDQTLSTLFRS